MSWHRLITVAAVLGMSMTPIARAELVETPPALSDLPTGLTLNNGPWRPGPSLELARAGLSAVVLDGVIYAAGGAGLVAPRDDFEVFEPGVSRWRPRAPLPVGLERFAMGAAQDRLWVAGGYAADDDPTPSDQVWSYDPAADIWQSEPSLPGAKASFSLLSVDDRLFAVGGEDGMPGMFVYDLEALEWSALPAPVETNRRGAAAVVHDGEIWLIGGVRAGEATARIDVYSPVDAEWRRGPDLPEPRAGHAAVVADGVIHVFGGRSSDMQRTVRTHWALTPTDQRWAERPLMPSARTEFAAVQLNTEIWLVGGGAGAGFFAPFTAVDTVDVYSPDQP